jgi:hypothetical protein
MGVEEKQLLFFLEHFIEWIYFEECFCCKMGVREDKHICFKQKL